MSRLALGDYDKCEADLVTAARLEPGNRCDSDLVMTYCESDVPLIIVSDVGIYRLLVTKTDKSVTNITKLSPTYFVLA